MEPRLGILLFLSVACLPCKTGSIYVEPEPGLFIQKQQLTAAGSHSQKGSPGKIILTQCQTHGPSTLFLPPWVREVQITEHSTHCLCWYSFLCVSLELPWYQHKSLLQSSWFDSETGRDLLIPPSLLSAHSLRHPFSLGCSHTFLCQEIPSCTEIHSAVLFHHWDISRQGLCICHIYHVC